MTEEKMAAVANGLTVPKMFGGYRRAKCLVKPPRDQVAMAPEPAASMSLPLPLGICM